MLHFTPLSVVVAAVMLKYGFRFSFATSATFSAADEVGTSKIASTALRSYISAARVLATSGLFWWSAVTTVMSPVTALSPCLALKSATAISTALTEFFPDSSE